jgi:hypothetical protein
MNKEKRDQIKNKIKAYAPAVIGFTAAAGSVALIATTLIKTANKALLDEATAFEPLPVVTGEERTKLLEREDTILQKVEDDVWFLSVVPNPEV